MSYFLQALQIMGIITDWSAKALADGKVSLDEAVEIGKKFGGEDSGRYINGVLDNIYSATVKND